MSNAAEMDPSSLTYRLELDDNTGEYLLKPIFTSACAKKSRPRKQNKRAEKAGTKEHSEEAGEKFCYNIKDESHVVENVEMMNSSIASGMNMNPMPSPSLSKDSGVASLSQQQKLINQKVAEAAKTSIMERFFNSQRDEERSCGDEATFSQKSCKSEIDDADNASISDLPQLPRIIYRLREEFGNNLPGCGIEELSIAEYVFNLRKLKRGTFDAAVTENYNELRWTDGVLEDLYEIAHSTGGAKSKASSAKTTTSKEMLVVDSSSTSESFLSKASVVDVESLGVIDALEKPPGDDPLFDEQANGKSPPNGNNLDDNKSVDESVSECDFSLGEITLEEKSPGHLAKPVKSCLDLIKDEPEDEILNIDVEKLNPFLPMSDFNNRVGTRKANPTQSSPFQSQTELSKSRKGIPEFIQDSSSPTRPIVNGENNQKTSPRKSDSALTMKSFPTANNKGSSETSPRSFETSSTMLMMRPPSRASSLFSQGGMSISLSSTHRPHLTHSRPPSALSSAKSPSPNLRNSLGTTFDSAPLILPSSRISLKSSMPSSKLSRMGRGSIIFASSDLSTRGFHQFLIKHSEISDGVESLETSIAEKQRQLFEERRNLTKIVGQLRALDENEANRDSMSSNFPVKDTKTFQSRLKRQLEGQRQRIKELENAILCLQSLHFEASGFHHSLLHSLMESSPSKPFQLMPFKENSRLEIEIDQDNGNEKVVAGTPRAFISYLFDKGSLRNGFLLQFFYVYRYLLTPIQLYNELLDKFMSSLSPLTGTEYLAVQVVQRTMDLLQIWVECFHSVDFRETPPRLLDALVKLVKDQMRPLSDEFGDRFLRSLDEFRYGKRKVDVEISESLCSANSSVFDDSHSFSSSTAAVDSLHKQKWASFVPTMAHDGEGYSTSRNRLSDVTFGLSSCIGRKKTDGVKDVYFGTSAIDFNDGFTLADYSVQTLACCLSKMQRDCFKDLDPVDVLDTKSVGVVVSSSSSSSSSSINGKSPHQISPSLELILTKPSTSPVDNRESGVDNPASVFLTPRPLHSRRIVSVIRHSQMVSHWVAAELLTCSSLKIQMATLTKFVSVAKCCHANGDFASCAALAEALESLMVKQLPAWRSLPARTIVIWERVSVFKKRYRDSDFMFSDDCKGGKEDGVKTLSSMSAIIPPICHVIARIQELEAKGFIIVASPGSIQSGAEQQKFSWNEFRVLAEVVDEIRKCRKRIREMASVVEIGAEEDVDDERGLVEALKQRILKMAERDIVSLASKNEVNFALKTNSTDSKIHSAFKNVKGIFKGSSSSSGKE